VEISAPLLINKRVALTVIDPASPLPVDTAVICGPGSRKTMSEATTITEPPAPVPAVVLAISEPPLIVICGALTVTVPALPLAVEVAEAIIPLPEPTRFSGSSRESICCIARNTVSLRLRDEWLTLNPFSAAAALRRPRVGWRRSMPSARWD